MDPKLSGKWHGLFTWSLLMGVITGFASFAVVMIGTLARVDEALMTEVAVVAAVLAEVIVAALYLRYMKQTLRLLAGE